MSELLKRPWKFISLDLPTAIYINNKNKAGVRIPDWSPDFKVYLDFMLECCNCHNDLVAACKMGLAGLEALFKLAERLGNEKPANILSIEFIEAVLAKVKKE